jgi:hypothetical protein
VGGNLCREWPNIFSDDGKVGSRPEPSAPSTRIATAAGWRFFALLHDHLTLEVYPMPLTRAQVAAIAEKARKMPRAPRADTNVTNQEAIRLLERDIVSLQRKGYTLKQITDSFRGDGLDLSTATMKSYLSRAKAARQRRRGAPPPAVAATKGTAPLTAEARPTSTKRETPPLTDTETTPSTKKDTPARSGKDAFLVKDKDSY